MILAMENLSKSYAANTVLEDITLKIEDNDRIGLIGVNGAGKSTLLRIITGIEQHDEGTLSVSNHAKIGFLQQNSGLESSATIIEEMRKVFADTIKTENDMRRVEKQMAECDPNSEEYIKLSEEYTKLHSKFEAQDGYQVEVKIKTILNGMGFADKSPDTVTDTLSGGEKTRLALAKLLLEEPDLLILDEPTNHLDFKTLTWLEGYLSEYKGALLIVSHDRYFLDKLVTSICEIERHKLIRYKGNYSKYLVLKKERLERQQKEYEIQSQQIADMEDYVRRNIVRASTAKSAKSRVAALERMERVEKPQGELKSAKISFKYDRPPVKDVLKVSGIDLRVGEGEQEKLLFDNLDFNVLRGEKVAIIGANGVGKSTFLKVILGKLPHTHGTIEWGKHVNATYFDQEGKQLNPDNTVLDELWNRFPTSYEQQIRNMLGGVLLTGENVYKKVSVISGGERAKLGFAVLMAERGNVLVLDEPTNHLDLDTKEVLDKALCSFDGTIITVSHDRYLLNKLPTRIVEFYPDSTVREYKGNYDYYLERRAIEQQAEQEIVQEKKEKSAKKTGYRTKQQKSADAKRKLRIKELEALIAEYEEEIGKLEASLSEPEVMSDYVKMNEVCQTLEERKAMRSDFEEEWLELIEEE